MEGLSSPSGNKVSQSVVEVGRRRNIPLVSQSQMPGFALEKDKMYKLNLPICYLCEGL